MKILIATGIYPPEIGGPAGYVKGLATALVTDGHEVKIVTYGDKPEQSEIYQIANIKRGKNVLVRYFKYAYRVWRHGRDVDVIYAQGPMSEGFPATIANLFLRKPLVMKVVGDYAWEQYMQIGTKNKEHRSLITDSNPSTAPNSKFELLDEFVSHRHNGKIGVFEKIERWTAGRATKIITPSKYLKTIVEKWGVGDDKIKVVYNSIVPLPNFTSLVPHSTPMIGMSDGRQKVILTAVRAVPWKGGDFLCDVIKELPSDYMLAVAGDGPELENWKKYAQQIGVQDRVEWLGRLSRTDLTDWYRRADLFVLATGYEGFPHVVVEAASVGLRCVVSDKGGNPEIAGMFPEQISVAPYRDKQAWVEAIKSTIVGRTTPQVGLPEFLGFERMVEETFDVISSAHCLNLDSRDLQDSHDYSSNKLALDAKYQIPNTKYNARLSVLSISLEKKLFEPGKVRDRIVNQLKGFDATIIVFAKQKFSEQIAPNVRVISTASWNKFFYVTDALIKLWKLRKQNFNAITTQDPVETALVGILASRLFKTTFTIQDHGYTFHGNYYRKESFLNFFRYWFARLVITKADAIRVVSQRTEDALLGIGVSKDKIVRFPLELTPPNLPLRGETSGSANSTSVDAVRGTSDVGRYFLLVCRFVPIKRIDIAIHAFSLVVKSTQDVKLKIIGQGSLKNQIDNWIKEFNLQDRVEVLPWTDDLAVQYQNALATLITSDREGFGMTAIESLSCGTPVIMTDVGCAGEAVHDGENGFVVPIGDVAALADRMVSALQRHPELAMSSRVQSRDLGQDSSAYGRNDNMSGFIQTARYNHSKLLVCVEAVDQNDPLMGYFVTWLQKAAQEFKQITVLALRVGEFDLPKNVSVYCLKNNFAKGFLSRFETVARILFYSIILRKKYNSVFSRGEPMYIVLFNWLWHLLNKKTILFYAHYKTSGLAQLANELADITATSVPEAANNLRAIPIGQAVDSDKFHPPEIKRNNKKYLVFGRVS
ncbi:glycosyltransferase family 4 protein, partial [Patescibacteria group bacterium]|nr:glycosyltransferase family 4 protein [Patescibacteria group bacterium]